MSEYQGSQGENTTSEPKYFIRIVLVLNANNNESIFYRFLLLKKAYSLMNIHGPWADRSQATSNIWLWSQQDKRKKTLDSEQGWIS